jgi:hypothetical protein
MTSDLVANVHSPLKPGAPPPAAVSGPTTLAPTTTLAPASSGSFGGDERGGADRGDGGDSENRLADHASLLVVIGCVLTSYMVCHANDPSVQQRESQIAHFVIAITFAEAIRPFRDSHHIRRSHCRTILCACTSASRAPSPPIKNIYFCGSGLAAAAHGQGAADRRAIARSPHWQMPDPCTCSAAVPK